MKSELNESCTEGISYMQVNNSIIKDQTVLSVLVSQPALEGPLVAEYLNPELVVKLFRLLLSS